MKKKQKSSPWWEPKTYRPYSSVFREHTPKCRCCNQPIRDGDRVVYGRSREVFFQIHATCGNRPFRKTKWTWLQFATYGFLVRFDRLSHGAARAIADAATLPVVLIHLTELEAEILFVRLYCLEYMPDFRNPTPPEYACGAKQAAAGLFMTELKARNAVTVIDQLDRRVIEDAINAPSAHMTWEEAAGYWSALPALCSKLATHGIVAEFPPRRPLAAVS